MSAKELNIGYYIRTKDGFIGKITEISSNEKLHLFLKAIYTDNYKIDMVLEDEIIKSSSNIIDLIEVGDYVNGYLVTDVYKPDGNKVFRIEIERDTLKGHIIDKSSQIKSIITKEQFESMEYKVE